MQCPVCGSGTAKKVEKKNYLARYNRQTIQLPRVEMSSCSACEEDFLTPAQACAFSIAMKNKVRERDCLLPPQRITAIRKKAGLTQEELENLLGQGPKVVTRWESGKVVQNRSADTVLRLIEREPDIVKTLRTIEKRRCTQSRHASLAAH